MEIEIVLRKPLHISNPEEFLKIVPPGLYDRDFLPYLRKIRNRLRKNKQKGVRDINRLVKFLQEHDLIEVSASK